MDDKTEPTYEIIDPIFDSAMEGILIDYPQAHTFGRLERGDDPDLSGLYECPNTAVIQIGTEYFLLAIAKLPEGHSELKLARRYPGD